MKLLNARHLATCTSSFFFILLLLIDCSTPVPNYCSPKQDACFQFFEDFDGWIQRGYEEYAEPTLNKSLTAEVIVGTGEKYGSIQDALGAGAA